MPRRLTQAEIDVMVRNGCRSSEWDRVVVGDGFSPDRVWQTVFEGAVQLECNTGYRMIQGVEYPCGISNAVLSETLVGENVLIRNIGTHIFEYVIEDHAVLMNVAELRTETSTVFGQNGSIVLETGSGSLEIPLVEALSAPVVALFLLLQNKPKAVETLRELLFRSALQIRGLKGVIGRESKLFHCGPLVNMRVGPGTVIDGASRLKDGTICGDTERPVRIGPQVSADSFILLPGSVVASRTLLQHVRVGEGVRLREDVHADHALFFHGETRNEYSGSLYHSDVEWGDCLASDPKQEAEIRVRAWLNDMRNSSVELSDSQAHLTADIIALVGEAL